MSNETTKEIKMKKCEDVYDHDFRQDWEGLCCIKCGHFINEEDVIKLQKTRQKGSEKMKNEKTLNNTSVESLKENVSDIVVFGDGNTFQLIYKASSKKEGWMKSTKACETVYGCLVQVTTQQRNPDGSYSLAEALTFAPSVTIDMLKGQGAAL